MEGGREGKEKGRKRKEVRNVESYFCTQFFKL